MTSEAANVWQAIQSGDLAQLSELLDADPTLLTAQHETGHRLVRMAADLGQTDVANWLIGAGAPIDAFDSAALGDFDRLQSFVEDDPHLLRGFSHDGWTLLHLACFAGDVRSVDWLLTQGADLAAESRNAMANQPLHAGLAGAGSSAVLERLLAASADVNFVAASSVTALHLAASRGDQTACKALLAAGATQLAMDDGQTPSDLARSRGHDGLAQWLSER